MVKVIVSTLQNSDYGKLFIKTNCLQQARLSHGKEKQRSPHLGGPQETTPVEGEDEEL